MTPSLPLLRGSITLSEALSDDHNILQQLSYPGKRLDFFVYLYTSRVEIEAIVSLHLGVPQDKCTIGVVAEWIHGSFNVCIPVHIRDSVQRCGKRVMVRFPLPYKVGEAQYPGNMEEKLRTEAATYIWIRENCPAVPIPYLWGFGFPGGRSFITFNSANPLSRLVWYVRQFASWMFGRPTSSRYISYARKSVLEVGYLILEYVEDGEMLSRTWETLRQDRQRRANLFADLSRLMLSSTRSPLPRIGSLTIDDFGVLSLSNRPLTLRLQEFENMGIATNIARNQTYSASDAYLQDLLECHDNRIRYHPNAILSQWDGEAQLSALTVMRSSIRHFTNKSLKEGPFILMLTDLHPSNIFVNSEWHITRIIDLEWTCARPAEMLRPPYWLTGQSVDNITDQYYDEYCDILKEFMDIFAAEESRLVGSSISYTDLLWDVWKSGKFWYFFALDCPKGLYNLFSTHVQPLFTTLDLKGLSEFEKTVTPYWDRDAAGVIAAKLKDRDLYISQLRDAFNSAENSEVTNTRH